MKKIILALLTVACCFALCFVLAGCQNGNATDASENNLQPEATDKPDEEAKTFSNKPFYALIVGNDTRNGTKDEGKGKHGSDGHQRSDTMMLVRVDPQKYLITIVSIPRDTQTTIDGETCKINEAYNRGGIKGSVAKVEEYTGVNIKYYFDVSFAEFAELVDALGGVDVNVPVNMTFRDILNGGKITLEAGEQHLEGNEALVFARVRKVYQEMDSSRQYDDRSIVVSLIQKALDNPSEVAGYIDDFADIVHTNMSTEKLVYYVNRFVEHSDDVKFYSGSFPADGDINSADGYWYAWYNPDTWNAIMDVVDDGGDPNDVYTPPFG